MLCVCQTLIKKLLTYLLTYLLEVQTTACWYRRLWYLDASPALKKMRKHIVIKNMYETLLSVVWHGRVYSVRFGEVRLEGNVPFQRDEKQTQLVSKLSGVHNWTRNEHQYSASFRRKWMLSGYSWGKHNVATFRYYVRHCLDWRCTDIPVYMRLS